MPTKTSRTVGIALAVLVSTAIGLPNRAEAQTRGNQPSEPIESEQVTYRNAQDGTELTAVLRMPERGAPHPGVVLLTVAGTHPIVERLVGEGYAVLTPERRGFVAVEPLLQASYGDLAGDVAAALAYLRAHDDVDGQSLGVVAQADDAPPAILALGTEPDVPLVLLAPPGLPGVEEFRREQRQAAERAGASADALASLDSYVMRIAEIALGPGASYTREYRLEALRQRSPVQLPISAAFPSDDRQMHFFASRLWRDRLRFEPEAELAALQAPVLVIVGADDPNPPLDVYMAAVRRGLGASFSPDASVCLLAGRTRHTFTDESVATVSGWLGVHLAPGRRTPETGHYPPRCLEEEGR